MRRTAGGGIDTLAELLRDFFEKISARTFSQVKGSRQSMNSLSSSVSRAKPTGSGRSLT